MVDLERHLEDILLNFHQRIWFMKNCCPADNALLITRYLQEMFLGENGNVVIKKRKLKEIIELQYIN